MKLRASRTLGLVLLLFVAACAPLRRPESAPLWAGPPPAVPSAQFTPAPPLQFLVDPYPEECGPSWLGADVASSIRLGQDRYAWLFGDTLLGSVRDDCPGGEEYCDRRVEPEPERAMIRNSVGISARASDGAFRRVVKYWPTSGGEPRDMFPSDDGTFLWPLAGARVGPYLYVTANRNTPESGLAPVGNVLLRIDNPDDSPEEWSIRRWDLPHFRAYDGPLPNLVWTTAIVPAGKYVYLLGQLGEATGSSTVLARFPVTEMAAATWPPKADYLLTDERTGRRRFGAFDLERLHRVGGLPGTSEATVDWDPDVGWYSYRIPPLEFDVRLYTAGDLRGPWRDEGAVYRLPAPWSTAQRSDCPPEQAPCPRYIAYAVKAHPELAPKGARVLSYNVNIASGSFAEAEAAAEESPGFYVPQLLIGPAKKPLSQRP